MIDDAQNMGPNREFEEVAVIGMAGRFPGARDLHEFWHNLCEGVESLVTFTRQDLEDAGLGSDMLDDPEFVPVGTVVADFDSFDANFFGFSPTAAGILDPQHRIFLETVVEALDDAGYDPGRYSEAIGVFAGCNPNEYARLLDGRGGTDPAGVFERLISNESAFLATRVSHKLNLTGPSINVQTACSTSLVAVHLACRSLLDQECSITIAGGVALNLQLAKGYISQKGMILSPDGHCRAFDKRAGGTVLGQGSGVVVLKRLSEALADGDNIRAIIKGTAVNNDGSAKVGYAAPSEKGQASVIANAQAMADVSPDTVSYVETHGTGTRLGDPIEVAALTRAFRTQTDRKQYCAIGSVKTNIGHLDSAAGITGLIKTVLALQHKCVPPSLHYEESGPDIDFENSPFFVNTTLREWDTGGTPRRAGVSSFGIGGTNAHAVLEEAPVPDIGAQSRQSQLLVLSAKTETALETATINLTKHLRTRPSQSLADVSFTLQKGRGEHNHRRILVCRSTEAAIAELGGKSISVLTSHETIERSISFLFPGQGSQYPNMGKDLYETEETFRNHIDTCFDIVRPHLDLDLRQVLYPQTEELRDAGEKLMQTDLAQPALFAVEYALAQQWRKWGVEPSALLGHSIGEYVSACLAGVMSLEDALALVVVRGRLMQGLPRGSMLSVALSEDEIQGYLSDQITISAINGALSCVVSGETRAIIGLEQRLSQDGVQCQKLKTSHAFHSPMMDPILRAFASEVAKVELRAPQIPFLSNLSGTWIKTDEALSPNYWARHIRQTVRFSDNLRQLLEDAPQILLEVGPGNTLMAFARQHRGKTKTSVFISSLRHPKEKASDTAFLLKALGRLWLSGVRTNWDGFYGNERRRRVSLPSYPFERRRFWAPSEGAQHTTAGEKGRRAGRPSTQEKKPLSDWFYLPSWKRFSSGSVQCHSRDEQQWLVFVDELGLGSQLVSSLEAKGDKVLQVRRGHEFSALEDNVFTIDPREDGHYSELLETLDLACTRIVHLWNITRNDGPDSFTLDQLQDVGLYSLLGLAKSVAKKSSHVPSQIDVVSNNVHEVTGDEVLCPAKATILGPIKVIPLELPNIICRHIDVVVPEHGEPFAALCNQLTAEFLRKPSEKIVAIRRGHRWIPAVEPVRLRDHAGEISRLREHGVYWIIGGLGGIGLQLAQHISKTVHAKLILTGRSALPKREAWDEVVANSGTDETTRQKIRTLLELESIGSEILAGAVDTSDFTQMRDFMSEAVERFGPINGVIHCAGVIDSAGVILRRSRDANEEMIKSKVRGTLVLEKLFERRSLDFLCLCSSMATTLYHDRFGQVGYVSGNSFLDSFPFSGMQRRGTHVVTINWDDWLEVGMTITAEREFAQKYDISGSLFDPLNSFTPAEGVEVFSRVLNSDFGRVMVSTRDLEDRLRKDVFTESPFLVSARDATGLAKRHPRPDGAGEPVQATNSAEEIISEIWSELLGIVDIGIGDNFFDLGGDSLRATQVLDRIQTVLGVELSLTDVFEEPTVLALAERVAAVRTDPDARNTESGGDPKSARESVFVEGEL